MERAIIAIVCCLLAFMSVDAQEVGNTQHRYIFRDSIDRSLVRGNAGTPTWFRILPNRGLEIQLKPETVLESDFPNLIGKPVLSQKAVVVSEMEFSPKDGNETAGLILYQEKDQFYYLCKSKFERYDVMQLYKASHDQQFMDLIIQKQIKKSGGVRLKITIENNTYSFYFSEHKDEWKPLREKVFAFRRMNVTKPIIGLYASSNGQPSTNLSYFKYLEYAEEATKP